MSGSKLGRHLDNDMFPLIFGIALRYYQINMSVPMRCIFGVTVHSLDAANTDLRHVSDDRGRHFGIPAVSIAASLEEGGERNVRIDILHGWDVGPCL